MSAKKADEQVTCFDAAAEAKARKKTTSSWEVSVSGPKPRSKAAKATTIVGALTAVAAAIVGLGAYLHSLDGHVADVSAALQQSTAAIQQAADALQQPTVAEPRSADPPFVRLPAVATFSPGLVLLAAETNGQAVEWISPSPQLQLIPPNLLRDSKTLVAFSTVTGSYPVYAYSALGDVPSPPAASVVVIGAPGPVKPDDPTPVEPTPNEPSVPAKPGETTAVVYVYEKDQTALPPGVQTGLNRLNRERNILATSFEDDTTDGTGEVPDQYKVALAAARAKGLPALVVLAGDKAINVIAAPTTEAQVMEAAK